MLIRPAAVAGLFYPDDPAVLRETVEALLARRDEAQASTNVETAGVAGASPAALIAPHAGFQYSGPIAASAFRTLVVPPAAEAGAGEPAGPGTAAGQGAAAARPVRRVVLLGPAHRVAMHGLGLPLAERFATPLGEVMVDADACAALARLPQVAVRPDAHHEEHALEVELPFLQVVLGSAFQLVPLVVGQADGETVAAALEAVWSEDSLVVVSSDLSHYLPAVAAEHSDRATNEQILALAGPLGGHQACGAAPINGLLLAARRRGLAARLLDLRHSGDTAGDRTRVVGYGAWAFAPAGDPGAAGRPHDSHA